MTQEQSRILETVFVLMLPIVLTKVLGQLFNLIIASFYGVDDSRFNQFLIANTIPELLTNVLMVGAVGTVIIPILIESKEKDGEKKFYRVYSSILNFIALAFTFISTIIIILADQIIPFAINMSGGNFLASPAELENMANMMRAMIIPQLILGISVFVSSGLNIYHRYIVPQLSGLFFNIGRVAVALILIPIMDFSPWALVAAIYAGAILHLVIQLPLFFSLKIRYYPKIDFKDPYLRELMKLGLPRILVLASDHVGLAFNKFLSVAFAGGPAALNFAVSIYALIPSLFGYTFSYAAYPTIAKLYIEKKYDDLVKLAYRIINEIIFLSLPFIVLIIVLRVPITRLFFGIIPGTELDLVGTYQVAWILLFFGFGLAFITARWFLFSMFYAAKDTFIPSIVTFFSLFSVVILSILFTNFLSHTPDFAISKIDWNISNFFSRAEPAFRPGVGGISLAMSLVYTIEFIALLFIYSKRKINLKLRKMFKSIFKKLIAASVMAGFTYFTYKTWVFLSYVIPSRPDAGITGSTTLNLLIMTIVTVIPAFLIYFLMCYLLKVEDLKVMRKLLNPIFKAGGLKKL